jgi:short-subunit dehydrogenase
MKELEDKVVVITGASSGIGRATALEFARQGAKLVLAGRDANALHEVEQEATDLSASAITTVCDVVDEKQVEALASKAEEAYGHIDIWVNNAGVNLFGKFDDTPSDDYRRVIETNFFGYVHGTRAALTRFKAQNHGSLINVDAIEGVVPTPFNSAYAASKHAIRALASSLRMELLLDELYDIHVSTVVPASVDTPMFAHAANYTRQGLGAPAPTISPEVVAQAVCRVATKPQREFLVGGSPKAQAFAYGIAPGAYEKRTGIKFWQRRVQDSAAPISNGNLYKSTGPHSIFGGWTTTQEASARKLARPILFAAGAIITAGAIATWLIRSNGSRKTEELIFVNTD